MVYAFLMITDSYSIERGMPCRKLEKILATLARNLIFNTCAKAIEFIKQIIACPEFIARHRFNPKDFTLQQKLPFHVLVVFLINLVKGSYRDELDKFFKTLLCRFIVAKSVVPIAVFTKAQMKLRFEVFIELIKTHTRKLSA